jgi:hypothetical protein
MAAVADELNGAEPTAAKNTKRDQKSGGKNATLEKPENQNFPDLRVSEEMNWRAQPRRKMNFLLESNTGYSFKTWSNVISTSFNYK